MKQRIKCLIAIVNREKGDLIAALCHKYGVHYTYGTLALGTASSELLDYLGIGETDKEMMFSFVPECLEQIIMKEIATTINIKRPGHGIMFSICLRGMSALFQQKVVCEQIYKEVEMKEIEPIERAHELIIAVVEHEYREQVMDAAKAAGATGGTVLHARSMHDEDRASFFGIKLQGEKDVVMILTPIIACGDIMKAINACCGLQSDAKGLIFSLPVDNFIGM